MQDYSDILSYLKNKQTPMQQKQEEELDAILETISSELKENNLSQEHRKKLNLLSSVKKEEQEETKQDLLDLSQKEKKNEEELLQLQTKLKKEQQKYEESKEKQEHLKSSLEEMKKKHEENLKIRTQFHQLQQSVLQKENRIKDLEKSLSELSEARQNNHLLLSEKETLQQELSSLQQELQQHQNATRKSTHALDQFQSLTLEYKQKIQAFEEQQKIVKTQIATYQENLSLLTQDQQLLQEQKKDLLEKHDLLQKELDAMKLLQEKSEELLTEKSKQLVQKETLLEKTKQDLQKTKEELQEEEEKRKQEEERSLQKQRENELLKKEVEQKKRDLQELKKRLSNEDLHAVYSPYEKIGVSLCSLYLALLLSKEKSKKVAVLDLSLQEKQPSLSAFFNSVDITKHALYQNLFKKSMEVKKNKASLQSYRNIELFTTQARVGPFSTAQVLQALENLNGYTVVLDLPRQNKELLEELLSLNKVEKYLVVRQREDILSSILDNTCFSRESLYKDFHVIVNQAEDHNLSKSKTIAILEQQFGIRTLIEVPKMNRRDLMEHQNRYEIFPLLEQYF